MLRREVKHTARLLAHEKELLSILSAMSERTEVKVFSMVSGKYAVINCYDPGYDLVKSALNESLKHTAAELAKVKDLED